MVEAVRNDLVGTRALRLDAADKLTGRARYASDYRVPGMLHGKIVRSDRPHARITSIDARAALELPGVEAVLYGEVGGRFGEVVKDQTPFAIDTVRYIGDPVAAIAAETPEIAEEAARLLEIEYEDLRQFTTLSRRLRLTQPCFTTWQPTRNRRGCFATAMWQARLS